MEPKVLIILFLALIHTSSQVSSNTYSTFIKTSCNSTTYPSTCLKSLLPYASTVKSNPLQLVNVALSTTLKSANATLSTTLKSANATLSTVTKLSKTKQITEWEAKVVKDCIGDIKDCMDEIKSTIKEVNNINITTNKRFAISNAQTWTSAAITDENSCIDGFSDRQMNNPAVKKKIRNSIVNLARVSSNALYLINHLSV
ncbi:pectinesterase inhibitor 4-like [Bidens hawaiensis]|uniref:pectinesterase inhibitor 4-like n=1 Tax=Bidens hawaiensis TaxID=980011 RepID=UPI00404AB55B